jgi:hypothetical protein
MQKQAKDLDKLTTKKREDELIWQAKLEVKNQSVKSTMERMKAIE